MRFRHSCSLLAGTLAVTSLTLAGGAASAASATTRAATVQRIGVPDHATLTIHGRGYGHGHGMSQWGAQGAAKKGLSATKIVRFYYPHTKAGHAGGKVRVLIMRRHRRQHHGGEPLGPARPRPQERDGRRPCPRRARRATPPSGGCPPGKGGRTKVSYRNQGWHLWSKLSGDGEFTRGRADHARDRLGQGHLPRLPPVPHAEPSREPVSRRARRVTVNKTSLEAYVQGVIPREAFPSWRQAALRAQAIAARSYAAFEEADSTNPVYQLCDTTSCQVYGGKTAEVASTNKATAKTKGQVRTYHGKPAFTQFSASNGGWLAAGSQPYLVAKKDPYDGVKDNPNHTWTVHRTAGEVEKAFPALGNLQKINVLQRDGNGKWNGRIESMKLVGSKGSTTVSGDTFRSNLGLLSTWFDISVAG